MPTQAKHLLTADTFNRGALRMTVALLRGVDPKLALHVQNQMRGPINPQSDASPSPKDNFRLSLEPIEVRRVVETLKRKADHPNADAGTEMLIKALIIDWVNYANFLIEKENNKNN
ncbi:hypothetical protein [Shewanella atlantica]|uniref:hypothetical protein n=1 Tax=Shewanella atlantica TaxID=271099 RepID=UPI003735E47C